MTKLTSDFACALLVSAALACPAAAAAQVKPAGQQPAKARTVQRAGMSPHGFSVVLVLGEMQGNGAAEGVPAAARKALADMKDFLPYKGYRLLDTQWTLCCGTSSIVTRLRGADEQEYTLELNPSAAGSNGQWHVRFALREPLDQPGPDSGSDLREAAGVAAQKRELEARLKVLRESYSESHPQTQLLRAQIAHLEQQVAARQRETERTRLAREEAAARLMQSSRSHTRSLIDTSFTMDIGETVVVGTSRIRGDQALIALLTAVASTRNSGR